MIIYKIKIKPDRRIWSINGKLHREDGPAVERANGDKEWYINDQCHREDGPAIECANGDKYWYLNDKLHREEALLLNGRVVIRNGTLMANTIVKMDLP